MSTLENLERLVGFASVSAESNVPMAGYIRDFLLERGFRVQMLADPSGDKAGIFAAIGPMDQPGVLLSGHMDVVPVVGQDWASDPFVLRVQEDRAFGRGTTDMKGFLAAMLTMADQAARMPLRQPLKLAFSYDEELGCLGIAQMLEQLEPAIGLPRFCLVGEPTQMQVAIGHKGKAAYQAVCHGQAGHSANAPQFANALHLAVELVAGLRDIQQGLAQSGARDPAYDIAYSTVHVGKMTGGTALNIVPERAEVDFEIRHVTPADATGIFKGIETLASDISARFQRVYPEAGITLTRINAYPGLNTDPASDVVRFAQNLARSNATTKVGFGTEAGYFSDTLGIPTVVCGPGSMTDQGHKANESIALSELAACDAMLGRLLDYLAKPPA